MTPRSTSPEPTVTDVAFTPARPLDVQTGLLGFVAFTLASIRITGVALRRTVQGRLDLRFPTKRRGVRGREFAVVCPTDEQARQAIEIQVRSALERQGVLQ